MYRDIYKIFNFQYYKHQAKKKRTKRTTKYKFIYYVVRKQEIIRTTTSIIQTKISISLKSLVNNSLKKKQEYLTNKNCLLNVVVISRNIIINYLVKKLKLDLISIILMFFFSKT